MKTLSAGISRDPTCAAPFDYGTSARSKSVAAECGHVTATVRLVRRGKTQNGRRVVALALPNRIAKGRARLVLELRDAAGNRKSWSKPVLVPGITQPEEVPMKTIARAATLLLALVLAGGTLAAATPNRAKTLILKPSDFPKGVQAKNASGEVTAEGSGWSVSYHFASGGRPQELAVAVLVFRSPTTAKQMFRELKGDVTSMAPKLALKRPLYGDEQVSSHAILRGSQLLVRKGAVIWYLEPQTYMVRAGKQYELSRAQTIAIYEKYGRLQQRRIG